MIKRMDTENNFNISLFPRLFSVSILLFAFIFASANATEWCRTQTNTSPCVDNIVPMGWTQCDAYNQETVWCNHSLTENTKERTDKKSVKKPYKTYAGLSLGYAAVIDGGITADYADRTDAWKVPGSFQQSSFQTDIRSTQIQFSFGAEVIDSLRIDISYMTYSGISIPNLVRTATGNRGGYDGYFSFLADGGDVSGNATMLNAYYSFDPLIGRLFGDILSLYVGAGIGMGTNEISDYDIFGKGRYSIDAGLTSTSDIHAFHFGNATKDNLVYMVEMGVSSELSGFDRLALDFFVRWTGLGSIETSGKVVLTQTIWEEGGLTRDEIFNLQDFQESGTLNILDVGVRLRFLF